LFTDCGDPLSILELPMFKASLDVCETHEGQGGQGMSGKNPRGIGGSRLDRMADKNSRYSAASRNRIIPVTNLGVPS